MRKKLTLVVAFAASFACGLPKAARADEVTFWNDVLCQEFRTDYGQGCPCPLARAGAMVHVAIFDAVNSIDHTHQPYMAFLPVNGPASREAAVAAAAHATMRSLFSQSTVFLETQYAARLALIPNGPAKDEGIAVGEAAAAAIIAARANDGSQNTVPYTFGGNPGDYRPTFPTYSPICNNEWVTVTPFCMNGGTHYRTNGPLGFTNMVQLLRSARYALQVNEVKLWGSRNSPVRTEEQTRIAFFWANDANGTYKPPGHIFQITKVLSDSKGLTLSENARLYGLVALAMGDAGIAAWDMKYGTAIDLWRPISAIREADTDGNPLTVADPNWEPLNPFTPPFPAYVSGHATFAGASSAAMAEFFGTDRVTFTVDSEDPYYNALPQHGPRTFRSLAAAAWENALSRIYLGVHYRMDAEDGFIAGTKLGRSVGQNFLRPLACPADINGDGSVNVADLLAFSNAFAAHSPAGDFNRDGQFSVVDWVLFLHAYQEGC